MTERLGQACAYWLLTRSSVPPHGTLDMIQVILPLRLRTAAHADREVTLEVEGPGYLGRPKNKT